MRKPEEIKELDSMQITAYYKSFIQCLDEANKNLSDWEMQFVESCLRRVVFTDKQKNVIRNLMDKYGDVYPRFDHYKTHNHAETYLHG